MMKTTIHPGRSIHAQRILGDELFLKVQDTKILLVGAGGIGCEVLKTLALSGFTSITLLDLDTIDLTNLNRQFLFRTPDVGFPKATIAARTASQFNPSVNIKPIHSSILLPEFSPAFFQSFDLVLNALDNLPARRHVNKMCLTSNPPVPLIESGTAGYLGQVQPILGRETECFDCLKKETPKTFPVCTIRSTPSLPIHCIVWAKSYLLPQLFGVDENENAEKELDSAQAKQDAEGGEKQLDTLRKEAKAFKGVRAALRASNINKEAANMVFDKVYTHDIQNLLTMADMWKSRAPPTPLSYASIIESPSGSEEASTAAAIQDQTPLTLRANLLLFVSAVERLSARASVAKEDSSGWKEENIEFDKDDPDTLDFVTAASNLRSTAYGIPTKTRWEVKEMAGNIIPAIATTNAIISGLMVLQALNLLRRQHSKANKQSQLRNVHIQLKPTVPLSSISIAPPNPNCGICRDVYLPVVCNPSTLSLQALLSRIRAAYGANTESLWAEGVSIYEASRLLADPDWDDNLERSLIDLNIGGGMFVSLVFEEDGWETVSVAIQAHESDELVLPESIPALRKKPVKPKMVEDNEDIQIAPPLAANKLKRRASSPDITSNKRTKMGNGMALLNSPKKRKLEEDGVVLLDGPIDMLDDKEDEVEVIEID